MHSKFGKSSPKTLFFWQLFLKNSEKMHLEGTWPQFFSHFGEISSIKNKNAIDEST